MITFGLLKHVHLCYIKACLCKITVWSSYFDELSSNLELHRSFPIPLQIILDVKALGTTTKVAIRNDLAVQSCEGRAFWGEAAEGTLCSGPSSDVSFTQPSHNNTLWCLCSSGFHSCCSSEGSQFMQADESAPRLMSHWWTRPTCVFQQAVPLGSQRSTVFPHTNTFYGEFRAPCSLNICFPKWFCYRARLAHIRAGSGLDHRLSTLLRSFF